MKIGTLANIKWNEKPSPNEIEIWQLKNAYCLVSNRKELLQTWSQIKKNFKRFTQWNTTCINCIIHCKIWQYIGDTVFYT